MLDRERVGRGASPTAAVLDSQSVRTTESGGPRGYDAGKKVKGRKRQALVDTDGRALVLAPQPADVQDRDGAVPVLEQSRRSYPFVAKAFADAGDAGDKPDSATLIAVEIVRKPPGQVGFVVHPRRWVVERLSRLDQPQSAALEGPGGHHRFRQGLPLRRIRHDAAPSHRSRSLTSRRDSQPARQAAVIPSSVSAPPGWEAVRRRISRS